jgi:hypothetical protein
MLIGQLLAFWRLELFFPQPLLRLFCCVNRPNLWAEGREIIFEDNHLLVINKPAGLLVQGDETGDEPLSNKAAEYLKFKYKKPGAALSGWRTASTGQYRALWCWPKRARR